MKRSVRVALRLLVTVAALIVIAPVILWFLMFFVFDEVTERSDLPLSHLAAVNETRGQYPPSAFDIYYISHAEGMQIGIWYERMQVSPDELESSVKFLTDAHNRIYGPDNVFVKGPLAPFPMDAEFTPTPWWNTSGIRRGYNVSSATTTLELIVDEEHSRIYSRWSH